MRRERALRSRRGRPACPAPHPEHQPGSEQRHQPRPGPGLTRVEAIDLVPGRTRATPAGPTTADAPPSPTPPSPTRPTITDADATITDADATITDADATITDADATITDPTITDPTITDPTITDPTITDPTITDPTITDATITDATITEWGPAIVEGRPAVRGLGQRVEVSPRIHARQRRIGPTRVDDARIHRDRRVDRCGTPRIERGQRAVDRQIDHGVEQRDLDGLRSRREVDVLRTARKHEREPREPPSTVRHPLQ